MLLDFSTQKNVGRNLSILKPTPSGRSIFGMLQEKKSIDSFDVLQRNPPFTDETQAIAELKTEGIKFPSQSGDGILDIAKAAFNFGKAGLKIGTAAAAGINTAISLATGETGTRIRNKIGENFNSNPDWRPGFAGEKHLILPTHYGLTSANWCGPGTNIKKRLSRGDVGVSQVDEACKTHDLLYNVAKDKKDLRAADERLIRDIDNSDAGIVQKNILKAGIRTKTLGEDFGIFGAETFTNIPNLQEGEGMLDRYGRICNHGKNVGAVFNKPFVRGEKCIGQRTAPKGVNLGMGNIGVANADRIARKLNTVDFGGVRKDLNPTIGGEGIQENIVSAAKMLDKAAVKQIRKVRKAGKKIKLEKLAGIAAKAVVRKILEQRGIGMGSYS